MESFIELDRDRDHDPSDRVMTTSGSHHGRVTMSHDFGHDRFRLRP